VAYLGSGLNVRWALTNGPSADDLTSAIAATGIAFLALFLAAQLLVKIAASGFISVDMTINGLMANTNLIGNLDGAPLR
jgi:hypothetical protein